MIKNNTDQNNQYVDFLFFREVIIKNKRWLIYSVLLGVFLGVFYSLILPNEYTVSVKVLPQVSNSSGSSSSLNSLASIAGVDLGQMNVSNQGIPPNLYPLVKESYNFKFNLANARLNIPGLSDSLFVRDYFDTYVKPNPVLKFGKQVKAIPTAIINAIYSNQEMEKSRTDLDLIQLSNKDQRIFELISQRVMVDYDKSNGVVSLAAETQNAIVSTQVVVIALETLQTLITDYKVKKTKDELKFLEVAYLARKAEYEEVKSRLNNFKDTNLIISTASAQAKLEQLEQESDLSYSIYSEIARQRESLKVQLIRETPSFSIIQPAVTPIDKTSPRRSLIVVIFTLFSLILTFSILLIKSFIKTYV